MTAATVTAAIMIFMNTIVSVNTTETGGHIQPDTEIATRTPTAAASEIAIAATLTQRTTNTNTWLKTLFDLSKNPIITQKSPKILTKTQTPSSPSSLSSASSLSSETLTQRKSRTASSVIAAETSALAATTLDDCKSLTGAWGDADPNVFYICDTQTKKPLQLRCPEGRGFFLGIGYSGCIPFEQWPACISREHLEQVVICDSEHMQQPWESTNPNKFYVCLKETIEPTILNCEPGKGFVHAIVATSAGNGGGGAASGSREGGNGNGAIVGATSEIVGCANWDKWRNYMHCNDYY
ncbi:uncharacterized protein ACRADG_012852 [Cochliomyia hominivorax]